MVVPTEIISLPNVGRCDHTYASWILNNYKSIQEKSKEDGEDIIFFVKDNNYHSENFYSFDELFTFTTETGFGCVEKPVCDCDHPHCKERKDIALVFHNQTQLENFQIKSHQRLKRDKEVKKYTFANSQYPNFKAWKDDIGFRIPHSEAIPVCYGGMFAVQKKQIIKQPEHVWQKIVNSLGRGNNIVEGHYAERMWASVLWGADEGYARLVTDALLPHIFDTFPCWNRLGMFMAESSKGFFVKKTS